MDRLTAFVAIAHLKLRLEALQRHPEILDSLMAVTRDDLKKKRLQAMGVVGGEMEASSAMYDRIIDASGHVRTARDAAETAHMGALQEQIADLKEMADDMQEFAQAVPMSGGTATGAPAATTVKPANGSALAALNAAQPMPKNWGDDVKLGPNGGPRIL